VKILLANDDDGRAEALRAVLQAQPDLHIVRAGPATLLADAVAAHPPVVVIVDMARPDRDAVEGVRRVTQSDPRPIVLFVDQDDPEFMEEAIGAGVCSYNLAGLPPPDIRPILRAAIALFRRYREAMQRLEERSIVDRAKAKLIRERRMTQTGRLSLAAPAGDGARAAHPRDRPRAAGGARMTTRVRIGLLRLVDSAPVLVAKERGLFADCDVALEISVEPSWANIADKLSYGLLDAAVMLPPLAIGCALGLRGVRVPLAVPMGLSLGGNSVVLAQSVAEAVGAEVEPIALGQRLVRWIRAQPEPPRFAVVHAFSTHNLLLRGWLAGCGSDLDRDLRIISVPPEMSVQAIGQGVVAGFCAGAPWGGVAEERARGESRWAARRSGRFIRRSAWPCACPGRKRTLARCAGCYARCCERGEFAMLLERPGPSLTC
jgi:AmiR/NasT family two-component response regulator